MDIKKYFGTNLKQYRKEKQLSQEQLSEKVNISVKHLSRIERGLTFVSADLLEKLSTHLEAPVAVLFCRDNERIYDSSQIADLVDRIAEKHLRGALEGIKTDIRSHATIPPLPSSEPPCFPPPDQFPSL